MTWPQMRAADLATFQAQDPPTRDLILRMLGRDDGPTELDQAELRAHPNGAVLAEWLLHLPAYASDGDGDGDGGG